MHRLIARRAAIILGLFLLASASISPAQAASAPTDVRGVYRGFFQSLETRGLWGNVVFSINEIQNRRWVGVVTMIVPASPSPIPIPYPVVGTISASGEFTGVGKSNAGMVQFHGRIMFLQGGAAIADSTYKLLQPGPSAPGAANTSDHGTATLLRNFIGDPNIAPPNVSGDWNGHYASFGEGGEGTFELPAIQQPCMVNSAGQRVPGSSFFGTEIIDGNADNPFYFRGSVNSDGMLAVIGWDILVDHFIVIGEANPPDPDALASAEGDYALTFANGRTDRGRLFDWTQQFHPPDPCRGDIIGDVSGQ